MSLWRTCKKHYIGRDTSCPVCRIAELEAELKRKSDMHQIMLANAANERIEELEAQVEALEGDGYMTAADFIEDWWNSSNVQGVATMDGEEMMAPVGSLRPDSERLIQRIIELPEADPNDENTVCINYNALRNVICNAALETGGE